MADSAPGGASDFNTTIIEEFRANQGRVGGPWAGTTLIIIHHIGARSGTERVTPLGYFSQGDGRFAIVASNGGSPAHPDWYHNLKANPRITGRGWCPDVHGTGGGAGRHRPRRAVAEAGRGVPLRRRIPGQDHAADSGIHADPPGLTATRRRSWRQHTMTARAAHLLRRTISDAGRPSACPRWRVSVMSRPGSSASRWGGRTRAWPRPAARWSPRLPGAAGRAWPCLPSPRAPPRSPWWP